MKRKGNAWPYLVVLLAVATFPIEWWTTPPLPPEIPLTAETAHRLKMEKIKREEQRAHAENQEKERQAKEIMKLYQEGNSQRARELLARPEYQWLRRKPRR